MDIVTGEPLFSSDDKDDGGLRYCINGATLAKKAARFYYIIYIKIVPIITKMTGTIPLHLHIPNDLPMVLLTS